jgi:hypothetical protein
MNKNLIVGTLVASLAFGISPVPVLASTSSWSSTKVYKSCSELQKKYKHGVTNSKIFKNKGAAPIEKPTVNKNVYLKNSKLDKDKDGIACEVLKSALPLDNSAEYSQPLETCKLRETRNFAGAGAKGFPARQNVPSVGNVKIAIMPVDFSNAPGVGNPVNLFTDDIQKMKNWAKFYSRGKLSYEVEFGAKSWIRAPRGAEWYTCLECEKGARSQKQPQQQAIQELVDAADKFYNFSDVKIIYFVFPYEAEKQFGTALYGRDYRLSSADGPIFTSVYGEMGGGLGQRYDRSIIWDHAVHEFLHYQGFVGHGPRNLSGYYISTHQWGGSKSVTSWEAFLNGWFGEPEILCLDRANLSKDVIINLDSIDVFGPSKESVMIRINEEQLIVIERRARGPYTNIDTGFTAYQVNVNSPHYRNDSDSKSESKNFWGYLTDSNSPIIKKLVEYEGVRISIVSETFIRVSIIN